MDRNATTKLQASGHRFLLRRMEYALACRDTRMLGDPIRAHSLALAAGAVLTVVVMGVCVALAVIRPRGTIGDAPIVMARESGTIYVRVGDTLHPAMNLASARLIARTPATPALVSAASISVAKRGPLMGIPGAPTALPTVPSAAVAWTVCDGGEATTVFVGAAHGAESAPPLLVRPAGEGAATVYLLFDGRRALVDLRDRPVTRALRLDHVEPLTISRAMLNLVPEVAAIGVPVIEGLGEPGPSRLPGSRVGSVLQVRRTDAAPDHYVVLTSGIQRIGPVAADLIRFAVVQGEPVRDVPADRIAEIPVVEALPLRYLPRSGATPAGRDLAGQVCVRWVPSGTGAAPDVTATVDKSPPTQFPTIALAQADGDGPHIDAVAIPDGAYVHATGAAGAGAATGPLFLIDQAGVAYGLESPETAQSLGLPGTPDSGPWPILAALPRGPALSSAASSVQRDGITPPA
ncbi:type VII secretion protein EccB [Mycolicibacterium sp. Y3]